MFLIILAIALFNLALGYGLALFLHGRNGPFCDWEFPLLGLLRSSPAVEANVAQSATAGQTSKPKTPTPRSGATADNELVAAAGE